MIRYKHSTLQLFPPPTGDGGCAQPPAPLPPSEPGGHATQREPNFVSLRFCLAAALRRQRLSLHEEYEEFKQRVDGQAQLIQMLSAELARLEAKIAFEELLGRLGDIKLDESESDLSHLPSFASHGYQKIGLSFTRVD